MPTPTNPNQYESTYVMNAEHADETARLLVQDRITTKEMGSLFPENLNPSQVHTVLDLACGPGGWVLDVARAYPEIDVVGVDLSQRMVRYAQAQADALSLENASFQVMSILQPLLFPEASFDLVNARFIAGFMPKTAWPALLQECLRVTVPGGTIRLTDGELGFSNSAAYEQLIHMVIRAMWLDGKTFSSDGHRLGTTLVVSQFLRDAGLTNIQRKAYALEYSFGTAAHESWYQDTVLGYPLVLPYLLKMGVTTQAKADRLFQQVSVEMQSPEFRAVTFFLSTWGTKS